MTYDSNVAHVGRHRRRTTSRPPTRKKKQEATFSSVIIPTAAGLVGALIGAGALVWVTNYQIRANQLETVNTALSSQEQAAYKTFLADGNELNKDWGLYLLSHRTNVASEIISLTSSLTNDYYNVYTVTAADASYYNRVSAYDLTTAG